MREGMGSVILIFILLGVLFFAPVIKNEHMVTDQTTNYDVVSVLKDGDAYLVYFDVDGVVETHSFEAVSIGSSSFVTVTMYHWETNFGNGSSHYLYDCTLSEEWL